MAATQTVSHHFEDRNSPTPIAPRHGVLSVCGFGIRVSVDRGHLLIEDGIGNDRRVARLPRVRHGLRRLVCIASEGYVTLSALRWLADQEAGRPALEGWNGAHYHWSSPPIRCSTAPRPSPSSSVWSSIRNRSGTDRPKVSHTAKARPRWSVQSEGCRGN